MRLLRGLPDMYVSVSNIITSSTSNLPSAGRSVAGGGLADPRSNRQVLIQASQEVAGKIRLVPDLSAAAFRQKRIKELALWHCLRYLNTTGSGKIDEQRAIAGLQGVFHYSKSTIYQHLKLGEGVFWQTVHPGRNRIDLQSLSSVIRALSIGQLTNSHFVEVSVVEFGSASKRKAQIYASIHHPQGIKLHPISRASIEDFTGISKQRQRRLEEIAHVRRFANYGVSYDSETGKCKPMMMEVEGKARVWTIQKRLPNSYQTKQQPGPHGQLKNIRLRTRSLEGREASVLSKVFFNSYNGLVKALAHRSPGSTGYARVSPLIAVVRGRQEWSLCMN